MKYGISINPQKQQIISNYYYLTTDLESIKNYLLNKSHDAVFYVTFYGFEIDDCEFYIDSGLSDNFDTFEKIDNINVWCNKNIEFNRNLRIIGIGL